MLKADDILKLSDKERSRLKLRKRYRKYKKSNRPVRSRSELTTYLQKCNIRSSRLLEKQRLPDDPNVYDYRKEFGSWSDAVNTILGSEIAVDIDAEYVLKSVIELGLWNARSFEKARKLYPHLIPSWRQVVKTWGGYRNLFECARRLDLKLLLDQYIQLTRKLGQIPNLDQLKKSNLRMDSVIKFYGSKKEMDDFVLSLKV